MERLKCAPKLSFDTGGEFIRQTRREVDESCAIVAPARVAERSCMPKAS
jgi:hypothetical protein